MDQERHHLFDTRTVERNISAGLITRKDYEEFLASLEDCADNFDQTEAQIVLGYVDEVRGEDAATAE